MKQAERRRDVAQGIKSKIRSTRTTLYAAVAEGKQDEAERLYRSYCSIVDKAAKKNVIKAHAASRRKARAAARLATLA